jgi:hypothetical protein
MRAREDSIAGRPLMPDSRLFMSSISRRELARRRTGRSPVGPWLLRMLLVVLLAAVIAAAFFAGRGSF